MTLSKKRIHFLLITTAVFLLAVGNVFAAQPVDFRDLVKKASPAVVNINTEQTVQQRPFMPPRGFEGFPGNKDLERFFNDFYNFSNPQGRKSKRTALGSGFIISSDGFIVTNNHVIANADSIKISFDDGKKKEIEYTAEVIGTDPDTDLALLKIKATGLPFVSFGDSDALDVGEWVLAIGNPLGLGHTITAGIVSAKGRNIRSGNYDDFLQTDASINPGNSGGPLLNMNGDVIGINTAIAYQAQGIGFAIPSSMAQKIISDLQKTGKVNRGWLGVTIQPVDENMAKALGLASAKGALINDVLEGQPAAKAGIQPGDVILAINDKSIKDTDHLLREVAMLTPGSSAKVTIWRKNKEITLQLTVSQRDSTAIAEKKDDSSGSATTDILGMQVRPLTPEDKQRAKTLLSSGLLIVDVTPDSPAGMIQLQPGDIIISANQQAVNSIKDLDTLVAETKKQNGSLLLRVARGNVVFFVAIPLHS